ncbi:MAG: leucine-rich repeat protein [Ruminococcus sp.]|nr:leucine-rich repeat protein [Ruminococcus sp.]
MKLRQIIAAALTLSIACGAFPVYHNNYPAVSLTASAASTTVGSLTFTVYSDYAVVSGYDKSETDIVIPDTVDGVPVTEIRNSVFMNCSDITSITMPDSITAIGSYAFWACSSMKLEKLPASLKTIGKDAFYRCDQITEIAIPEGVTEIPDSAFYWCEGLTSVTMSDNVTVISDRAFIYCKNLETIQLSPNITTIGSYAFYNCMKLKELVLTDAIQSVGTSAFANCSANIIADRIPVVGYQSNAQPTSYSKIGSPVKSYIKPTDSGFEIARADDNKVVMVDRADTQTITENIASIRYELPIFGGVFFGESYNFIVFGDTNYEEDDQREVFRIVKYSKDWERLGSTSVYGANTHIAVDGGSLRMAEKDGNLYVYTCHTMYASARDGRNHQANLMIIVNEEAMVCAANDNNYASHSFDQFVRSDSSGIYFADLGDAYPRTVVLHNDKKRSFDALAIQGAIGDNNTGVTLGGLELSDDNILLAGNTVDQSDAESYDYNGQRNIFISVTDKGLTSTSCKFLTDYDGSENISPLTPQLVKAGSDTFYVLWEELDTVSDKVSTHLAKLSGSGETLAGPVELSGSWLLSDCQPIFGSDGIITWYTVAETGGDPVIYRLDPEEALDPSYQPPVTTTAPVTTLPQTQTTAAGSSAQTTSAQAPVTSVTTSALRERYVDFEFSGLDLKKGERAQILVTKPDGEVRKLELSYTKDDGSQVTIPLYPDDSGAFPGGDSRTYIFTAECDLDEVMITTVFTGELPDFKFSFLPPETTAAAKRVPGDANDDGNVNLNDAVAILQYVALPQKYPLTEKGLLNADVDGQEGVNGMDALFIQKVDAGIAVLPTE